MCFSFFIRTQALRVLGFIFVFGCTTKPKLDSNLTRSWSNTLSHDEPFRDPYVAEFSSGSYKLIYLAAHHENKTNSKTFKLVKRLIENQPIQAIIIEPIPFAEGINPQFYIDYARKGFKDNFVEGGESAWAVLKAQEKSIPFFGGEPTHQMIFDGLTQAGYSELDIIGFFLIRQIPQWKRQKQTDLINLEEFAPDYIKNSCGRTRVQKCPTFLEVKKWYKDANNKDLTALVSTEDAAPYLDSPILTQRISGMIGTIRDKYTVGVIEKILVEYKTVLVVYGASHFMTTSPAFIKVLGHPHLFQ